MAVTTTNLIQGPATLYVGLFGATEPATVATAPGAGWTDVGGTQDGVTLSVELTYSELNVDQVPDIPGQTLTKRVAKIMTNLAEPTLANWARALNEPAAVVTSNKLTPSLSPFQPTYSALILDGVAPGGFRRRVILRRALQVANMESAYKKDSQTLIPVEYIGHYVSASIAPFSIEDAVA